jgi:MFS family permease
LNAPQAAAHRGLLDMDGYQWTVLLAAWLGWGFDVFDGLLFNYVAPTCVPTLLHLKLGSPEAKAAALHWTGLLTSLLLVGWAMGGIVFGRIADRIGRTRTLLLTMLLYSLGTAACALAPNLGMLALFRLVSSLGIGGEWAAGAAMVAEVVPDHRRVEAGALLYSSGPLGLFLATFVTWQIQGVHMIADPETAWRYVFLTGLLPAAVALLVRMSVREPERWKAHGRGSTPPKIAELFTPEHRAAALSGLCMSIVALVTWWSCNAFIPLVATGLAAAEASARALEPAAARTLSEAWKALATNMFNLGGLIGTLATVPFAKTLGRKPMYALYYLASGIAVMSTFGLPLAGHTRLYMFFFIGLTVFGVFGSFTYYLPELFPTRLRGTGAGFCYNAGRIVAAVGPILVGNLASHGAAALEAELSVLFWVGAVPLAGLLLLPFVVETRGRALAD